MTIFEHAMLGATGSIAFGLHRRYSWRIVLVASVAAVVPDWDGLTLLLDLEAFAAGHRLWGHNLLACLLAGSAVALFEYRYAAFSRPGLKLLRAIGISVGRAATELQRARRPPGRPAAWLAVGTAAAISHLPADMLVSGTAELPHWHIHPFWPFSNAAYVYPLVHWGDAGLTIVFVVGMFAMAWRPQCAQPLACGTLAGLAVYILRHLMIGP
jgi:membrane-bound metal-dependent hydrolase YbcI (DUF457 family)